jgi:predicted PurR-regulated permease PerM
MRRLFCTIDGQNRDDTVTDIQRVLLVVILLITGLLVHLLKPILMPFLVGALLAYLGDPIADKLEQKGLSRSWAVTLVFVTLFSLIIAALLVTIPQIGQQIDLLATKIPQWLQVLQTQFIPWLQERLPLQGGLNEQAQVEKLKAVIAENWGTAGDLLTVLWQRLAGSGMALAAGLANLVLIPVVAFYMLRDWDVLMANIRDMLPRNLEPKIVQVSQECDEILSAFLRGQLLVMLALGVIYAIGLSIVGLEMALLLGMLAGLAAIIPYMGFIVGISAASIAAWFQFYDPMMLVWVAVVFGVGQILESVLLTPVLVGDKIGLHPVAVIFAVMAGGQLAGFTGVLLGLPVAAVVMVILRHLHRSYKNSELYST